MDSLSNVVNAGGLASLAAVLVGITLVSLVIEVLLDWRAKRPLLRQKSIVDRIQDFLWLVLILSVIYLPDEFEKRGLPAWLAFLVPLAMIVASTFLFFHRQQRVQQKTNSRPNPNAQPGADSKSADGFSAEEVKVNARLLGLVVAFGVVSIGLAVFLLPMALNTPEAPSMLGLFGMLLLTMGLLAVLTFGIVGRWPGKLHLKSSIIIQRPLAEVWNALQFRETSHWWNPIVKNIQALPGPGENYRMYYLCDDSCAECGLPRDPDVSTRSALIEVLQKQDQKFIHSRARLVGSPSVEGLMECEENIRQFEALGGEATRVTSHNICVKPKMWLAIVLKLGDPIGEELRTIKGQLEGVPNSSLYFAGAARIAAHRKAEAFCGCARGAPIEGKFIT